MLNVYQNSGATLKLRINQGNIDDNSGCFYIKLKREYNEYIYTTHNVSAYPNLYTTLLLSEEFISSLDLGEYELYISDLNNASEILYKNILRVFKETKDNDSYYIPSSASTSYYDNSGNTLDVPSIPSVFNVMINSGVAYLSWTPVANAQYYEVHRAYNNTSFYWISNTYQTSLIDRYLTKNNMINYKVRACNSNGKSDFTLIKKIIY